MNKTYNLLVKFTPNSISNVINGKIFFNESGKTSEEASFLSHLEYRHVIADLAATGTIKNEENSIDFSQYKGLVYIKDAPCMSFEELQRLATALRDTDIVEYVEIEPVEPELDPAGPAPTPSGERRSAGPTSTTPNFVDRQDYLQGDLGSDVVGIDAMNAWRLFEATGQGIRCADIENGHFAYDHEDLEGANFIELVPMSGENTNDHGTAVAGVVFARNNGFGMLGVAHEIDVFYGISQGPLGRVGGIAEGLRHLRAGDVFIYEMQTGGREGRLVPADFDRGVWDITKQATDAGIIVIAAAGNGNEDLDHPFYEEYRNRGDNGSILVGAGTRRGRNRFTFSTFGSPIHLQGWGDGSVATCGVGDLFNEGPTKTYTSLFAATSAATAVVGAAIIAVQSWFKRTGTVITPRHMRELLIRTGTPQGTGGHIGPLPNIVNAIASQSAVERPTPVI
ncbi:MULTISPECIES: S8 family serine peptidase [Pseudomonas]|uniref:S8 family serine peptidase n=1 Tax=Pseudomonas TaxID=286 RepID=UPI001BE595C6|nr:MULTISPECIES: S8 family serine peptidase [Pseudomonas]MBT2338430.1 S8 family serine peptidase [Pseudomonas fluorescens]MCD4531133.1 S8 family serine peptidase [Pseudomonas sp. C3-2018]